MALSAKVVQYTKNSGTGAQALTGAGFAPKAAVVMTAGTTADATFQDPAACGVVIGLLTPAATGAFGEASSDGVVTSVSGSGQAAVALRIVRSTPVVVAEASLTSFDADGITLNWTSNDGLSQTFWVLYLGGADITNVHLDDFVLPTSGGNFSRTAPGFTPDLVIFMRCAPGTAMPGLNISRVNFGVMDSVGNQWTLVALSQTGSSPTSATRGFFNDCAISNLTTKASFVSMDANGYTLNASGGFSGTNHVFALSIKGGTWRAGSTTKVTGAAPASQAVVGAATTPKALILAGVQGTTVGAGAAHAEVGLGLITGTSQRAAIARVDRDNVSPTISKRYSDAAKAYTKVDNGTPAVDAAADLTSFDSNGFTLSWNPNDSAASYFGWITGGDNPPAPTGGNAVFDGYASNRPFARLGR